MDEQPRPAEEMPKSLAERVRERPLLWGAVAAVAVVVLGVALSFAVQGSPDPEASGLAGFEPVEDDAGAASSDDPDTPGGGSSQSDDADEGSSGTDSDGDSADGGGSGGDSSPGAQAPARAPFVAYRLSGALYVAAEDGSRPAKVADLAMGTYALSPDGSAVAYVDPATETLHIARVGGGDTVVGPAADVRMSWSPDSSILAYSLMDSGRLLVETVKADGSGRKSIGPGHSPSISPDGKRIALIGSGVPGQVGNVVLADVDGGAAGGVGIKASEVIWGGDGLVFSTSAADPGEERIHTCLVDGSRPRQLVGAANEEKPVMYASLCAAPSGGLVAYAAHGDDGFSRAYVVRTLDPSPVSLSVRRDTYPQCWSSDSSRVLFIEGNAFQGEPTSLMSATPDGLGRKTVVDGAGL